MTQLSRFFITVLNMSITASYVIAGVLVLRRLLRRFPRALSYALWAVVIFRLICPVSFSLPVSLLGFLNLGTTETRQVQYVPASIGTMQAPAVTLGMPVLDAVVNPVLPPANPAASVNPMQVWIVLATIVWLAGVATLIIHGVFSYVNTRRLLDTATHLHDNIYTSDRLGTAFVCGFFNPKIYIPAGTSAEELPYILEHERLHIVRKDYLVKPLAYVAVILHWFNPLVWLSFTLLTRDMEMSCDEGVVNKLGNGVKVHYSNSLLALSMNNSGLVHVCPLAFGESDVKQRIKNILSYKKPSFWLIVVAMVAVLVASLAFAANPLRSFDLEKTRASAMEFVSTEKDLARIGELGVKHYYTSFMKNSIPKEYRITHYKLHNLELIAGDEQEFCVAVNFDHTSNSLYWMSANGGGQQQPDGSIIWQGSYQQFRIRHLGDNRYKIVDIGTGGLTQGLKELSTITTPSISPDVTRRIEELIAEIMSSPKTSSNPEDYIRAHQNAYETILRLSLQHEALPYFLSQFESGNAEGLRGHILMRLCKELLGKQDGTPSTAASPEEWYKNLTILKEIVLPDFDKKMLDALSSQFTGDDVVTRLVYATEVERHRSSRGGFTIVAPKIFGQYEDGDLLKVFVTTYSATYKLYGHQLDMIQGSVVPSAITYKKDASGTYKLHEYVQARDGSEWAPSIRAYCKVGGREIPGLADAIMKHYSNYSDLHKLHNENLFKHLQAHGVTKATLTDRSGRVLFNMDR